MGANVSCQPSIVSHQQTLFVSEKKKRITSLATIRKRLIRRRKSGKSCDHARIMRELISDWTVREIAALWEEYESTAALKDLTVQADLARPPAPTYKQDLSDLFDYKYCTDVDLVFQGGVFPVHRAILSVRCPYFQEVLKKVPGYGAQIGIEIRTPGIDMLMFSALLRYLYTGEFNPYDGTSRAAAAQRLGLSNVELLMQLCDEFGTPNPLECDLRYLLHSGDYADCVLVFSSETHPCDALCGSPVSAASSQPPTGNSGGSCDYGFHHRLELYCHKAILSARSPFFRHLIQRRQRYSEDVYEPRGGAVSPQPPTRIILDQTVIPKRYAKVLVHAMYTDTLDLSAILRDTAATSSLSEAQSITQTGRLHLTVVEEAMEIYHIGRFLELDILTQGCEDLMVESLSTENIMSVLRWSKEAHGSAWVNRQALNFLREEFSQISQLPVLLELDKATMMDALSSDFLHATELEVLQVVLKWAEHQLLKRMEDREPNLVSQTAHSVARKGIRKRDINDVELREILSELLPHVRMDHVLPINHEVLLQAIKRGLVSTPPSHVMGDDTTNFRVNAWIRAKNNGLFVKPRLFTPYAEEVKSVVDERTSGGVDVVQLQCFMSHIPDTLYMIEEKSPPRLRSIYAPPAPVDVVAAAIPVPDSETVLSLVRREQELVSSPGYQRAGSLFYSDRRQLRRQVRLRVAREFNLPDSVADVLDTALYSEEEDNERLQRQHQLRCSVRDEGRCSKLQPPEFLLEPLMHSPHHHYRLMCQGDEDHLSGVMPDVAMASSLPPHHPAPSQMGSLEGLLHSEMSLMTLDLGDGSDHQGFNEGMGHKWGSLEGRGLYRGDHFTLPPPHRQRSTFAPRQRSAMFPTLHQTLPGRHAPPRQSLHPPFHTPPSRPPPQFSPATPSPPRNFTATTRPFYL